MEDIPSLPNSLSYGSYERDMGKLLKLKLARIVLDRIEYKLQDIINAEYGANYSAKDYEEYLILLEREEVKKDLAQELLDIIQEGLKE